MFMFSCSELCYEIVHSQPLAISSYEIVILMTMPRPLSLSVVFFIFFGLLSYAQPITTLEGVVEIRATVDDPWRPASTGDVLEARGGVRTFQGDLTLTLETGDTVRLSNDSELNRGLRAYQLVLGKAYVKGEAVSFDMSGPMRVKGEARFDVAEDAGARAVLLAGEARLTFGARVLDLELGQQLVIPLEGEPSFSQYFERDPWYKDLVVLEEGTGAVENFLGTAEIQKADGDWVASQMGDVLAAGDAARTGEESWLEFRFSDNTLLRLQANSELFLKSLDTYDDGSKRTVVELRKGKVWAVIEKGSPFEIETPGLVAGVRGTKFRVDAPEGDTPPLIKTFEGDVAGITGFEVFEVASGAQLDLEAGVVPLQTDALDEFNLTRDKLITAPKIESTLPDFTDVQVLSIQGSVDAGSLVTTSANNLTTTLEATNGTFSEERQLNRGVNIVEVSAVLLEGGKRATIVKPVIRTGYDIFFELNEAVISNGIATLSGFVTPDSTLVIGSETVQETLTPRNGYFEIDIPLNEGTNTVTLNLTTPLGDSREQTLTLTP
jgi:FecR protein